MALNCKFAACIV